MAGGRITITILSSFVLTATTTSFSAGLVAEAFASNARRIEVVTTKPSRCCGSNPHREEEKPSLRYGTPRVRLMETTNDGDNDDGAISDRILSRRKAFAASAAALGGVLLSSASPADAFDRSFPDELTELDPRQVVISRTSRLNSRQRGAVAQQDARKRQSLYTYSVRQDGLPSLLWGGALWFLSGSRSNPITTPLANALYDPEEKEWLRDRNAGLFAPPPLELLALLGVVFVCLGAAAEFALLQLAEGDVGITLQLAGVALLNGIFLEIGRIATGDKRDTREENDRSEQLREEFQEFAERRLVPGGNCHRNDVVKSFRRYFAKYRQRDSEEYPLTDLEVEKLLRSWNKIENLGRAEMTSSGFYYGIQINKDADVFA